MENVSRLRRNPSLTRNLYHIYEREEKLPKAYSLKNAYKNTSKTQVFSPNPRRQVNGKFK